MVLVNKSKWVRPAADFVKVNCDTSLDLKNRRKGVRIISRNEEGEALLAVCDSRRNVQSPKVAESMALWKAMQICNELNIQKVIFEGDAKTVIMAVKNDEEILSLVGPLIDDIRNVFKLRKDWFLQFDYREKNSIAHNLAKAALHLDLEKILIEEVPVFIVNNLNFDRRCKHETLL
ncbi:hypothetical protein F2P56_034332 [Juglans regia]|uniref:Uncharacterized protein LOC109012238 n=2 Tax=Juglans regia TaxID=51240 RepID=A0A2I4GZK1_JUGRE|nr:uncharacterized protein LOC109012238 [Juglans regia]KAF5445267.1 hypothetical protein F2P56_034332 [Juglans regia]